ncbi:hypothetical protein DUK53_07675 [Listeria sp. SHR_NRA_18]|nr:hypothetical protein DUK53_07675 [Listeria sp. SHR_NRA_18]
MISLKYYAQERNNMFRLKPFAIVILIIILLGQVIFAKESFATVHVNQEVNQLDEAGSVNKYHTEGITGKGIKIAILDTGVDLKNEDITFKKGINFTSGEVTDFADRNGHGTKIAGIIGARKNGEGLIGIAPESDLYICKVANDSGKVSFDGLMKGLDWAVEQEVDIINISLEFGDGDKALKKAIDRAINQHIIVIASSGNIRAKGDMFKAYPGAYPDVISVGMLNLQGEIYAAEFKEKKVDIYAPGEDLTSTYFDNKLTLDTGVSYATAYASGFAALVVEGKRADGDVVNRETIIKTMKADLNQGIDGAPWYIYTGVVLNMVTIGGLLILGVYSVMYYRKTIPRQWPVRMIWTILMIMITLNIAGRLTVYFLSK